MKKRCLYPIIVLMALSVLLVYIPSEDKTGAILVSPEDEEIKLTVEIADNPAERRKGLMYREELKDNHGMLFIFEAERKLYFWMKNTIIPLDIIFFDADKSYVSDTTMTPCKKDPCRNYQSDGPAQYALEVSAGFVEKYGVGRGWRLNE